MNPDDTADDDKGHRWEQHQRIVGVAEACQHVEAKQCARAEELAEEGYQNQDKGVAKTIADAIEEKTSEAGTPPDHVEGYVSANWILLDFGSVVVHVFHRDMREFYALEKLWADAKPVELESLK